MSGERKRSSKGIRVLRRLAFFAIVILALGAGGYWLKDLIVLSKVVVVAPEPGVLEVPQEFEGLVSNSEQVVTSSVGGKVDKVAPEGERLRVGALVARVVSQGMDGQGKVVKVDFTCPKSGLVSYNVDGMEGLLTPKNVVELDLAKFLTMPLGQVAGENIQSGQGVFKIVDNLIPTSILFKHPEQGVKLAVGDKVSLVLGEQKLSGKVTRISSQGPSEGVVVSLNSFLPGSLGKRTLKLGWLDREPAKGQLIPLEGVLERKGEKGVFVLKDGIVSWQGVTLLAQSSTIACVDGLKPGDVVVANPSYVREGQTVKSK